MALFQNSVVNKYLKQQDSDVVAKAYKKFTKYFHNPTIQQNIRERKEEQFQEGFLIELFVNVFDYTLAPNPKFNLTTELKNEKGAKKADGAILKGGNALGVIELKSTKTKDLEKVRQQAFDYKANQTGCVYVITSNFEKVRFYINNAVEFEEFDLFTINQERFELLYLCLAKDNLLGNVPLKIKEASIQEEEKITKKFYADYSLFKRELFRDLVKLNMKNEVFRIELNNEDTERANKNIKHNLFKKSQKLIDRFLFIFFAEDRGLLPPNSTLKILEQWDKLKDLDAYAPLYERYKLYFNYLDTGRKGTDKSAEIFAYNGGLFKPDAVLDSLHISDDLLFKHTKDLSHYDFESQVDVNILGHIFENSLNEIESVNAEIEGTNFDKQKTKRKKDGVFYTPKYITKYIVDNTVGKLCNEKKIEFNIVEEEYRPKRQTETKKKLLAALEAYREWLLQLTILDPACGSGAFLNQALDFLIKEHGYIDELQTNLLGGGLVFPNIENTVLENNIFGVDLNEESVEIAKLSLWLRTAQPRRKLNSLSDNIKCGNSIIDSKTVAGGKAFKWEEKFVHIFEKGGFDVVIGNPPYGDYFNELEKTFLLKRYAKSFSGTFDMYIMFFEIALHILKPKGLLCFITPNTFIDYSQFSELRNLLTTDNDVEQVLGLTKVFEDAIVDTAIILISKNKVQSPFFRGKIFKNKLSDIELSDIPKLKAENLETSGFILKDSGSFDVRRLTNKFSDKLSDIIKITQGITTGGNECFLNSQNYFLDNGISEKVFHKVLKGKTINRYRMLFDDDYILYSTKKTGEEEQSVIENLLTPFKERLSKKRETKQGKLPWYCLHWSRNEQDFNEPKILIRQTATHILGVLDTNNYYPIDSIHTLNLKNDSIDKEKELKFILGILNSKLFKYLYSWKLDEAGTVYPQVKKVNIEWLPMVKYDNSEKLSITLDNLLSILEKESAIRVKFLKYLDNQIEGVYQYTGIQNWHELEFGEFIKELNKAIKKVGGETLSKMDEMEWMEVFETKKAEAQTLKTEIDKTDAEIDAMVYELYGLSEDEIKIIEGC
ncbi:MAG: N-6 DNA methylase [Cyclobacteriaceae bacterium]|nr:N-6 DNA methylase [Cyclobacteriaceae bacterium]